MMRTPKFRVIIVGGGPVGLTAANIFAKGDIDFVVLEKHKTATPELGAGIAIWPSTIRILDQLGLWERLERIKSLLSWLSVVTHDGHLFKANESNKWVKEYHGHGTHIIHRQELLQSLYDNLTPDGKARVMLNKTVVAIETMVDGVRVRCADGTIEEGSIIIGADGVHSIIRQHMRDLALLSPPASDVNDEKPFLATYRVLFGSAPNPKRDDVVTGTVYETHGSPSSAQFHVGRERVWFFVYEPLNEQTRDHVAYSQADADAYASRWGDLHLTEHVLFKDVYATRFASGVTNIQEGVLKHWSSDRVVLVGDAAHSIVPHTGFGYSGGVQDLVVLANGLRRLIQSTSSDKVETESLKTLFREYESDRKKVMKTMNGLSASAARMSAGATWFQRILDYYVFPIVNMDYWVIKYIFVPMMQNLPVLYWLEEPHFSSGRLPWTYLPKAG